MLTDYERLAEKLGKRLSGDRLRRLDALRDAGQITSNDLPGSMQREFPPQLAGETLAQIRAKCGKK